MGNMGRKAGLAKVAQIGARHDATVPIATVAGPTGADRTGFKERGSAFTSLAHLPSSRLRTDPGGTIRTHDSRSPARAAARQVSSHPTTLAHPTACLAPLGALGLRSASASSFKDGCRARRQSPPPPGIAKLSLLARALPILADERSRCAARRYAVKSPLLDGLYWLDVCPA